MKNLPYIPIFFGDFLASTADWKGEEQSLYLTLLCHQWSIGSLPQDEHKLCRIVSWDRRLFLRCWVTVKQKFEARDGRLYNQKLENHREKAVEISSKRAESGKKGGLAKAKQLNGNSQANATILQCHPIQSNLREEENGTSSPLFPDGEEAPEENADKLFLYNTFLPIAGGNKNRARLAKLIRETRGEEETVAAAAREVLDQYEKARARGETINDPFAYLASKVAQHSRRRALT